MADSQDCRAEVGVTVYVAGLCSFVGALLAALAAGDLAIRRLAGARSRFSMRSRVRLPRRGGSAARRGLNRHSLLDLLGDFAARMGARDSGILRRLDRYTHRQIAAAGLIGGLTPTEVFGARSAFAITGLTLLPRASTVVPGRLGWLVGALTVGGLAILPDLWLRHRVQVRLTAIAATLPDTLDILSATVAAGAPLGDAISAVAGQTRGAVAEELGVYVATVAVGVPRAMALRRVAERSPSPQIQALVAAIERAEKHGSPLAEALAAQAIAARVESNRQIEERAAKAGPKIQLVASTLLVPAGLLAMAAVLVAAFAQGRLSLV